jgi:DNA-binding CsgD family transcriptional regulator
MREGLERLTEKEREALRLVYTRRSLYLIATQLGVSQSAVKQRLQSAMTKLDVQSRFDAARLLAEQEGWLPYPNRTGPNEQVVDDPDDTLEPRSPATDAMSTEVRPGAPSVSLNSILIALASRFERTGVRNALTKSQRLALILVSAFLALLLFGMAIGTISALGIYGRSLLRPDHTTI